MFCLSLLISETFFYTYLDAVLLEGLLLLTAMMRNRGNRKVVDQLVQLTELSKVPVIE